MNSRPVIMSQIESRSKKRERKTKNKNSRQTKGYVFQEKRKTQKQEETESFFSHQFKRRPWCLDILQLRHTIPFLDGRGLRFSLDLYSGGIRGSGILDHDSWQVRGTVSVIFGVVDDGSAHTPVPEMLGIFCRCD